MHQNASPAHAPVKAVVAAEDPQVVRRVAAGLDALSLPYRISEPRASALAGGPRGTVYFLGSGVASDLPAIPGPTIVVLYGARLSDEAVLRLRDRHLCTLLLSRLTPASLLGAVISARSSAEVDSLAEQLQRLGKFDHVPLPLITSFLRDPGGMTRLTDLRRGLTPLSREAAQRLVRSTGFSRAEHLFTALRCAAWALLRREGLNRKEIEQYLGIGDRTSFRRACRRAGVPALHLGLCPERFDA